MTEPILAIDFGTTTSAAIVVAGGKEDLIEEPSGHGRTWPSSVSLDGDRLVAGTAAENRKRRHAQLYRAEIKPELAEDRQVRLGDRDFPVTELITAILAAIRTEAERVAGREVRRAVITVPASYRPHDRRRALMLQAAADAGLAPVELLTEPVAAALAPATGTPIPPGSLLVVYDYGGGTFDTALVRVTAGGNEVLGYAALDSGYGGRDIDRELSAEVERDAGPSLAEHTRTERGRLILGDAVTALKHQLSDAEAADDDYGTTDIVLTASRKQLDVLAAPFLSRTLECVRSMLDACHVSRDDVTAVLMVGGVTRMPVVRETVARELDRPTRDAKSPELAVVQGAARFAAAAGTRFAVPQRQRTAERPLRWQIPGGSAELLDWLVAKGDRFDAGQPLGRVRLRNGAVWELRADDAPGLVGLLHARRDAAVFSGDWLVTAEAVAATARLAAEPSVTVGHAPSVSAIAVSPDGRWLATAGDEAVRVWDAQDGTAMRRGPTTLRTVGLAAAVLLGAPGLAASAAESRSPFYAASSPVLAMAYSPDGASLAIGCQDGSARVLSAYTGTEKMSLACGSPVTGASFSHDGAYLATSSDSLFLWDLTTREPRVLRSGTAAAVCTSPVASLVAAAYPADRRSRIIDAVGRVITTTACDSPVGFVAFSADGAWFASGRDADAVGVWDAHSGEAIASLPHVLVRSAAFSPDGLSCATVGDDGYARLWNITTADELGRVHHDAPVTAAAFSPDGRQLCTAGIDGTARLWPIQ